jgi:hypothetical protein
MYRDAFRASGLYDYAEVELRDASKPTSWYQRFPNPSRTSLFHQRDPRHRRVAGSSAIATPEIGFHYFHNSDQKAAEPNAAAYAGFIKAKDFYENRVEKTMYKIVRDKIAQVFNDAKTPAQIAELKVASAQDLWDTKLDTSFFWDWCFDHNIPVLIPLIVSSPHQQRGCDAAAFYIGNGKSARTFVGRCSWSESQSGAVDTGKYALRWYARTIATPTGTYVVPYALVKSYIGGNDRTYWMYGKADAYNNMKKSGKGSILSDKNPSRFVFAMDPTEQLPNETCMDITGSFQDYYDNGAPDARPPKVHYKFAHLYAKYWGFAHRRVEIKPGDHVHIPNPSSNTMTYHCHMLLPGSCIGRVPTYEVHVGGFGHMAHCAYNEPGCHLARTAKGPVDPNAWKDLRYKPWRSERF